MDGKIEIKTISLPNGSIKGQEGRKPIKLASRYVQPEKISIQRQRRVGRM